jgi:hypothetical protein
MYTKHGHHIPGTIPDGNPPALKARCGGTRMCRICQDEAAKFLSSVVVGVPVKYNGIVIGTADIQPDGKANITMETRIGNELLSILKVGMADGFSISPSYTPAYVPDPREPQEGS